MSVRSQKRDSSSYFSKVIEVVLKLENFTIFLVGISAGTPKDLEALRMGTIPGIPASSSEDIGSGSL